jgi:hypothetical protein
MDKDLSTSICIDEVLTELENIHHILIETGTLESVENCMFSPQTVIEQGIRVFCVHVLTWGSLELLW